MDEEKYIYFFIFSFLGIHAVTVASIDLGAPQPYLEEWICIDDGKLLSDAPQGIYSPNHADITCKTNCVHIE